MKKEPLTTTERGRRYRERNRKKYNEYQRDYKRKLRAKNA